MTSLLKPHNSPKAADWRLSSVVFFLSSSMTNNTQTRYAQFNALTVTGRIFNAEVVELDNSRFLSVSVISTASKDGVDIVYTFTNSNGLLNLHESGWFGKGRQVTITGHIMNVSEVYTDKNGQVCMRKRPEIKLANVTVMEGGLGPMPNAETQQARPAAGTVVTRVGTPKSEYGANNPIIDGAPAF